MNCPALSSDSTLSITLSVAAAVISLSSFVLSIFNLYLDRRRLKTESITRNRIEWIKEVRELVWQFVSAYSEYPDDIATKERIANKIRLYMRKGKTYMSLLGAIDVCIKDHVFSRAHVDELIVETQNTLNGAWVRMKREAGISIREDRKFQMMFDDGSRAPN